MKAPVIEVRDLDLNEAVRNVSFTVARGEVYALLGRYGSGKTALLEILAGLRRPTGGTVRLRGADPYTDRDAARAGAVWRDGGLFPGLTVAEVVDTWRRWTLDPITRDQALRMTGLARHAGVPFERLTAGRRRLLDLALALVGRSDVLVLDEPTAGLDGAAAREVWSVLARLAADGVAVVVTTRDPAEACRADRVGILDEGRLVTGRDAARLRAA
ncbi:ATP-binding cassette domain-containing protein [Actinomadura luteofluorescens]|uniref:ABC-2 type transport system ATP-binding protein n=1 Tax=Actinomadura luteofluorescens TaxID=46163 RepID=A0A7Y9JKP7_9ACTN|nr:ABC transporter ATP-binding protein [Actinomadura luteofluorescens]NYD50649.1 ABC-2 type transport system ATP-binding protein [Actinomadura luteofluorescens]